MFNGLPSLFTEQWSRLCAALHVWLSAGRRKWLPLIVVMSHWPCCYSVLLHLSVRLHVKTGIRLLVCHHPDLRLPPIPCISLSMLLHVTDWGWSFRNNSTEQRTFQPVALSTVAVPQHAASCTLYTHHYPLPIKVNTDVILSLFHWSLAPPWSCRACLFSQG